MLHRHTETTKEAVEVVVKSQRPGSHASDECFTCTCVTSGVITEQVSVLSTRSLSSSSVRTILHPSSGPSGGGSQWLRAGRIRNFPEKLTSVCLPFLSWTKVKTVFLDRLGVGLLSPW